MSEQYKYDLRGVSATKDEVHQAIKHLDKGLFPNAFCKILPDVAAGDADFCNIMHADTAGTKTSLAYLYWRETGDASVWAGIAQDAIVMNLDDLACVGCVNDIILSSTIGRNKNLIPGEVISAVINGTTDFITKMQEYDINIILAGGETADVGDIVRTIDVGITAFARMKRSEVIENQIKPGDVIVGLASFGQAVYENEYNGGMGSNGLTSARHDVLTKLYATKYPDSYDPNTPASVIYTGTKSLTETIHIDHNPIEIGKLILSPTRTYLPVVKSILQQVNKSDLHGIIHCSGGGQTKVSKFIDKVQVVKNNLFPTPPLFTLIQQESQTSWREMYQVFNMGHRLEFYVPEAVASQIINISNKFNVNAQIVGYVQDATKASVKIESPYGEFIYE
ncbi:MAG: AIR synthase related protein [Saprospiraceae bacterium]